MPYINASILPSCNNTELDLLQTEGEGIPKEMVKKLTENKINSDTQKLLTTFVTSSITGTESCKSALGTKPCYQKKPKPGFYM
jgi:hypothetical protein